MISDADIKWYKSQSIKRLSIYRYLLLTTGFSLFFVSIVMIFFGRNYERNLTISILSSAALLCIVKSDGIKHMMAAVEIANKIK